MPQEIHHVPPSPAQRRSPVDPGQRRRRQQLHRHHRFAGRALKATSDASSDATSSLRDNKIVRAAQDDAASFVASNGQIRSVKLESAFDTIRRQAPQLQASDAQLAQAILAI